MGAQNFQRYTKISKNDQVLGARKSQRYIKISKNEKRSSTGTRLKYLKYFDKKYFNGKNVSDAGIKIFLTRLVLQKY